MPFSRRASTAAVTAVGERAVLVEHETELVGVLAGGQLADQDAVLELGRRDVQGGGQVDDDGVDEAGRSAPASAGRCR